MASPRMCCSSLETRLVLRFTTTTCNLAHAMCRSITCAVFRARIPTRLPGRTPSLSSRFIISYTHVSMSFSLRTTSTCPFLPVSTSTHLPSIPAFAVASSRFSLLPACAFASIFARASSQSCETCVEARKSGSLVDVTRPPFEVNSLFQGENTGPIHERTEVNSDTHTTTVDDPRWSRRRRMPPFSTARRGALADVKRTEGMTRRIARENRDRPRRGAEVREGTREDVENPSNPPIQRESTVGATDRGFGPLPPLPPDRINSLFLLARPSPSHHPGRVSDDPCHPHGRGDPLREETCVAVLEKRSSNRPTVLSKPRV